jgi:penicillin-binding protein 2
VALDTNLAHKPGKAMASRLLVALWLVAAVFLLLASRLYTLQVLRGEELTRKGRNNFVQNVRVPHDRGIIYDRNGRILADNRPSLNVEVIPAFLGDEIQRAETLLHLGTLVGLTEEELRQASDEVASKRGLDRFQPIVVKRDLTAEEVEAIEAERSIFHLDGVSIIEGRRRTYPNGKLAAHLLGYVKEIDAPQLEAERARGNPRRYALGDFIGRDGIERTHEKDLRGVDGFEKTVVDAKGRRQQDLYMRQLLGEQGRVAPQPGRNVFLTIDLELQKRAEAAFDGQAGAVVVLDVRSGEVLALVSVPTFDPNLVAGLLGKEEKARLDADPLKPWVNRAISGQYAPGSTYKVVTGLAALVNGQTTPRDKVRCPGSFRLGRGTWRCHKDSGHGLVDMRAAFKVSCDVYFYTMGNRVGIDGMAAIARAFGFGSRTGIRLRNEQPGLVPDEAFHDRVDAATGGYQRGMAINTSIGQGSVLSTPLQLALAYAAIANGGTVFEPRLVGRIESADFRVVRRFLPRAHLLRGEEEAIAADWDGPVRRQVRGEGPLVIEEMQAVARAQVAVKRDHLAAVREGLHAVTNEPGGTAYWRRSRRVSMAGKTGTAQVVRLGRDRLKPDEVDYFERDHAWFAAYAPAEEPRIAVVALNEHSGHGSSRAAPIAVRVIDAWVELEEARLARAPVPPESSPGADR